MSEPLPVTVFFDYHCPYSDRVVRWLDLLTPERVAPDYRFFPLEQVNRDPTAETWHVWEQPLDYLHYRGRQDRRPLAPFLVSALVEAIAPGGPVATFRRLVLDARFDERRDITDLELLAALARAAGVDAERLDAALRDPHAVAAARERIAADWRLARSDYLVFGVPTLRFPGDAPFYLRLARRLEPGEAEAFLDRLVALRGAAPFVLELKLVPPAPSGEPREVGAGTPASGVRPTQDSR